MMLQSRYMPDIGREKEEDKKTQVLHLRDIQNDGWKFIEEKGLITDNNLRMKNYEGIKDVWAGQPCYIVGCGPSLKDWLKSYPLDWLDEKNTIGINHIIEDYDRFKWFFFLDKRFLEKTSYDLSKFEGRIFAQNTTGLNPSEKICVFKCTSASPSLEIENGLYNGNFSGIAALNLALITGADPIYLLGFGMGKGANPESYHYKNDYTGEQKTLSRYQKFLSVNRQYQAFHPYRNRVIHVSEGNDLDLFKKMRMVQFKKKHETVSAKVPLTEKTICHISFTDNISIMGELSREIINKTIGKHYLINQNDVLMDADLYIAEHFLSTDRFINALPDRIKEKTICLVHTVNCIPKGPFKKIIALTDAWKLWLEKNLVGNIQTIKGGINLDWYKDIHPDYSKKVFGRITRWSPGKIHPAWNGIVKEILDSVPDSRCLIYTHMDNPGQRPPLAHARMEYNCGCEIGEFKGDHLKNLSVYVHMNGSFKDTLSHAVIEAMATGLPVIYLADGTGVIEEVTGEAGIRCTTPEQVKEKILYLLGNEKLRQEYGEKSKRQALKWSSLTMINKWNELLKGCLL